MVYVKQDNLLSTQREKKVIACRTQSVLQQRQAVHTSHDTVLCIEHSQCYSNARLCTHLTTLCCMSNTVSATATPGYAHISRHCAVCRRQPVLQQHQAVHTSHDTVLCVEHSQCYSNTRLCTHLAREGWGSTNATDTGPRGLTRFTEVN
jgi:hypothetical protein